MRNQKSNRPTVCVCCRDRINYIDYKKVGVLRKFVSAQFKIKQSKYTGLCNKHQRAIANAVKRARYMALMPFTKGQTMKRA